MASKNYSVVQYRDLYMRKEDVDGLDLSDCSQPDHLHSKLTDLCSVRGYVPLLARDFVQVATGSTEAQRSIRVMQWNILAQGIPASFISILL